MEAADIAAVVAGFGRGGPARRRRGLDGVEVNAGQHSLVRQFLSGLTNLRERRLRPDRAAARPARSSPRCATRSAATPWCRAAAVVRRAGAVGGHRRRRWRSSSAAAPGAAASTTRGGAGRHLLGQRLPDPTRHDAPGFNLELCRQMRGVLGGPGRRRAAGLDRRRRAWPSGARRRRRDLVEMTRAQIADPDLVAKVARRRRGIAALRPVQPDLPGARQPQPGRDLRRRPARRATRPSTRRRRHRQPRRAAAPGARRRRRAGRAGVRPGGWHARGTTCGSSSAADRSAGCCAVGRRRAGETALAPASTGSVRVRPPRRERRALGHEVHPDDIREALDRGVRGARHRRRTRRPPATRIDAGAGLIDGDRCCSMPRPDGDLSTWPSPATSAGLRPGRRAGRRLGGRAAGRRAGRGRAGHPRPHRRHRPVRSPATWRRANVRLQQAGVDRVRRSLLRAVGAGGAVVEDRFTRRAPRDRQADRRRRRRPPPAPSDDALCADGRRDALARLGDCVAPRTIHEAVLEGRRAALTSCRDLPRRGRDPPVGSRWPDERAEQYRYLFRPLRLGPVTVRNRDRVLRPPHQLRRGRPAHRAARRLLRGAGRGRRRADHHRGALDPPHRLALREADPRLPPRGGPRLPAHHRRRARATARRSSPRSTTTAARPSSMYTRLPVWAPSPVADPLFREVPKAVDHARDRRDRGRLRDGRRALQGRAGSTASSCSARTARSCAASCRRPRTSAPTSTAGRWRTGPASCSRSSARCARRSAPTWRSACGCAATS